MPAYTLAVNIAARLQSSFGSAFAKAKRGAQDAATSIANSGKRTQRNVSAFSTGAGAALGVGLIGPLQNAVRETVRLEDSALDLKKAAGNIKEEDFAGLTKMLETLSVSGDTASSLKDLQESATSFAQLGFDTGGAESLKQWTTLASQSAVAFDVSAGRLSTAIGKTVNAFASDLPIEEKYKAAVKLADAYNHLSNNTASTASDLLFFNQQAAGIAKGLGLTGVQSAAFGSALISLGTQGGVAANTLKAMSGPLQNLEGQSSKARAAMEALGFNAAGLRAAFQDDAQGAIYSVLAALEALPDAQRNTAALTIFGEHYGDEIAKVSGALETYRKAMGLVGEDFTGSVFEEFQVRAGGMGAQLQLARNEMTLLVKEAGTALLPSLRTVLGIFGSVSGAIKGTTEQFPFLGNAIAVIAAGVIALKVAQTSFGAVQGAITALTWAWNVALNANPIGLVIAGVAALAGGAYLLYKNWDAVTTWFGGVWDWLMGKIKPVTSLLSRIPGISFGVEEESPVAGAPARPALAEPETPAVVQQYLERADRQASLAVPEPQQQALATLAAAQTEQAVATAEQPSVAVPAIAATAEQPSVAVPAIVATAEQPSVAVPAIAATAEQPSVAVPAIAATAEQPSVAVPAIAATAEQPSVDQESPAPASDAQELASFRKALDNLAPPPAVETPAAETPDGTAPRPEAAAAQPAPVRPATRPAAATAQPVTFDDSEIVTAIETQTGVLMRMLDAIQRRASGEALYDAPALQ